MNNPHPDPLYSNRIYINSPLCNPSSRPFIISSYLMFSFVCHLICHHPSILVLPSSPLLSLSIGFSPSPLELISRIVSLLIVYP